MTLGDILAAARRSSADLHGWLDKADPELAVRAGLEAHNAGVSLSGYVRGALADFSRFASEEDWVTVMAAVRNEGDPGQVFLLAMLDWRMTASRCADHQ